MKSGISIVVVKFHGFGKYGKTMGEKNWCWMVWGNICIRLMLTSKVVSY